MDSKTQMQTKCILRFRYFALVLGAIACGSGGSSEGSNSTGNNAPTCPDSGSAGSLASQLLGTWYGYEDGLKHNVETTFQMDGTYGYRDPTEPSFAGTGSYSVSGASEPPSAAAPWTLQMTDLGSTQNATTRAHRLIAIDSMAITMLSTALGSGILVWSRR